MIAPEEAALPSLAWLCALDAGVENAELHHGSSVIVRGDAFFEGAWAGSFAALAFDSCCEVFGSGGKRRNGAWTFVSPSHTLEALYVWRMGPRTVVSNSLVFLLTYCNEALETSDWTYGERFCSIVLGLHHTPITLPVKLGALIAVHHHNVVIGPGGEPRIEEKAMPPPFGDYASYVGYLEATLRAVFENAGASERRLAYRPLCTISSGYDSPACAALARSAGCLDAVTLAGDAKLAIDSGAAIARRLGLQLKELATGPRSDAECPEDEFFATGMQGEDVVYGAFAPELPGRVLLTGFHGDKVWEKTVPPSPEIKRGDVSGSSLGEFRLARDFVHVPVPFIGCRRHPDIWRVSSSSEMAAYSVGGGYDRPIPRRLIESAGVPRTAFAQEKRAASRHAFLDPSLLSTSTRAALTERARTEPAPLVARLRYLASAARWHAGMLAVRSGRALRSMLPARTRTGGATPSALGRRSPLFRRLFGSDFAVFEHSHPRATLWLVWGVERLRRRYALTQLAPSSPSPGP